MASVIAMLVSGLLYYLRPFWWESYRYENDQVMVRLIDAKGSTVDSSFAGTLVIRITGAGMERCGWEHSAFRTKTGFANGALQAIDSISTQFTDDAGIAQVPAYAGIGRGKRGFMGGCQYNRGFLLLISRPGYETKREMPRYDRINDSYQVIRPPRARRDSRPVFEYARDRLWNELQLLYPSRINSPATRPDEVRERQALMSMAANWGHKLPGGQTMRSYAIETIMRVNTGLGCPRLQAAIREIFNDPATEPETEAEILAEHNALRLALSNNPENPVDSCELNPG